MLSWTNQKRLWGKLYLRGCNPEEAAWRETLRQGLGVSHN